MKNKYDQVSKQRASKWPKQILLGKKVSEKNPEFLVLKENKYLCTTIKVNIHAHQCGNAWKTLDLVT